MVENKVDLKGANIVKKMITARSIFFSSPKNKSGSAQIAKGIFIQYYTLDDIIPIITKIETTCGILCHISFEDRGVLTIYNADNPEETLTYKTPISMNALGRGSEVQNIGAMETYSRRYLYLIAFDIVEPEQIDQLIGTENAPTTDTVTKQEVENIKHDLREMGVTDLAIKTMMQNVGLSKWSDLRRSQIQDFMQDCVNLQRSMS